MRTAGILTACLLIALTAPSFSQEGTGKFDPVIYLNTFEIGQQYTKGKFIDPPYVETTFENYMIDRADILAFTIRHQAKDTTGWTLWMDFEIQQYGQKRLTRVFAQKAVAGDMEAQFEKQLRWIEQLLEAKLCGQLDAKKHFRAWGYEHDRAVFTLKLTAPQEDGQVYLTIDIRQVAD